MSNFEIIPFSDNDTFEDVESVKIRVLGNDYIIRADQDPQEVADEIIKNKSENL